MTTLTKRQRGSLADLFDWLEVELPGFPVFRPFPMTHVIRVEEFEKDGQYVLRAELPGLDSDKDVEIAIREGILTVKAERREEDKEPHHTEFRYGTFSRTLRLPPGVDEDDVKATYADGILEVRVGIETERATESKQIPVTKA